MTTPDSYRKMPLIFGLGRSKPPDDATAARLDSLARCYLRLAEQAEKLRNSASHSLRAAVGSSCLAWLMI